MTPCSGSSVPKPSAGIMSVPRAMERICITVKGSGMAPRENKNAADGTASATLLLRIYRRNLRRLA
jgi:hypothetical protein